MELTKDFFPEPDMFPCGIIVCSADNRIIHVNTRIAALCNQPKESLPGRLLSELLPEMPNDITESVLCTTLQSNASLKRRVLVTSCRHMTTLLYCVLPTPEEYHNNSAMITDIERDHFLGISGKSPVMQEVYNFIEMAASTDSNVVILGESGSGKELAAVAIHQMSRRQKNLFVRVNCAALTETLLESELFGHVKGAFTGAFKDHFGKFEYADKGTLFLDEIGEITPSMQAKLLRVLQEKVITRVGDNKEIAVDVRIIAATNKNLRQLVTKGIFREDLFYRLNVFPIHLPPLRERKSDIPLLVNHFISKFNRKTGKQISSCSHDTMRIVMAYCWPGNVRELENAIEHAFVLCKGTEIQTLDLPHELRVAVVRDGICAERKAGLEPTIHTSLIQPAIQNRYEMTIETIQNAITRHNGNKTAAARELGISKVGLWKKMKKLGM
ncbi:MAG: sigma-54 interaction domain-containing protein [Fibrobacterota bacterium]|nr:sigma 54-interacting transcriptional regulator [Chitinispirillaceae bacterium]